MEWSATGSSNFDDRSFETNDEISLSIADQALAARLDAIFERSFSAPTRSTWNAGARRGWWHKLKDQAFYLLNELM